MLPREANEVLVMRFARASFLTPSYFQMDSGNLVSSAEL